jgi:hypothetical protein
MTIIISALLLLLALHLMAAAPVNEVDKKNRDVLIYLLNWIFIKHYFDQNDLAYNLFYTHLVFKRKHKAWRENCYPREGKIILQEVAIGQH